MFQINIQNIPSILIIIKVIDMIIIIILISLHYFFIISIKYIPT
jgi:hypothetical protein